MLVTSGITFRLLVDLVGMHRGSLPMSHRGMTFDPQTENVDEYSAHGADF